MAYDPMEGFQIGQAIGKGKKSALSRSSDYMGELFKTRDAKDDSRNIDKILKTELIKSSISSPKEKAMTDFYKEQTNFLKGNAQGSDPSDIQSISDESGMSPDDYIMKPTVTRYKGKTSVVNTPTLKDPLDPKATSEIGAFRRTSLNLKNNLGMLDQSGVSERMGPLLAGKYSASRMPGANAFLGLQSMTGDKGAQNFATFKAETDKVFQQFRKETTGAQAALKELGWLEPDYPSPTDPPDLYRQKANEAMKRLQEGENLLLDLYSQRGFRVGGLRQGSQNPLQQGIENSKPSDPRALYNQLRAQGVEKEEAKRQAGIK